MGECNISNCNSRIYIIGIGPGNPDHITPAARKAIENAEIIIGYKTYLDLIQELIKDKVVITSGMRQEVKRCTRAVELSAEGKRVAVICSGDPGIYAMAGLVFEILRAQSTEHRAQTKKKGKDINSLGSEFCALSSEVKDISSSLGSGFCALCSDIDVEVIPGIPAFNAAASRLGAPLMHDFASISLSDLLTPWELIERRLEAAARADFVIVLYNPKSKGRLRHINKALKIISRHRLSKTPVGIVKGAMRKNEKIVITDLKNMLDYDIDMQTTVIIGNSKTFLWNNLMITPRGYEIKKS